MSQPQVSQSNPEVVEGFKWHLAAPWAVLLAAVVVYANNLAGPFIFDDEHAIEINQSIREVWPPNKLLASGRRMVTNTTFAINHALNRATGLDGLDVVSFHLFNLLIHGAAGMVLFGVIRRTLLLPRWPARAARWATPVAFAAALVWVVHPLNTQAVSYIVQRAESLMALCYLLTLYGAIRAATATGRGAVGWGMLAVGACALGMGVKEVIVTAPVAVLLYDWVFLDGTLRQRLRSRGALYVALACTWLVLVALGLGDLVSDEPTSAGFGVQSITPLQYAMTQTLVILHYLRLAFWPHPLVLDYYWQTGAPLNQVIGPGLIILTLLALSVWGLWRRHWLGFCGAFFFLVLSPTSSFVPITDVAFEHRMYLPLTAVVMSVVGLVVTYLLPRVPQSRLTPVSIGLLLAVTVPLAGATLRRNVDYRSGVTIWQSVVDYDPTNPRAWNNLGLALESERYYQQAIAAYQRTIELEPGYDKAYNNLGALQGLLGMREAGLDNLRIALMLQPDDASYHYNLGNLLLEMGNVEEAQPYLQQAVRLKPDHARATNSLGLIRLMNEQIDEAEQLFRHALSLDPQLVGALNNLGNLLLDHRDDAAGAVAYFDRALAIEPQRPMFLSNRGRAALALGRPDEALRYFQQARQNDPSYRRVYLPLGRTLIMLGRLDEAILAFETALQFDPAWIEPTDALASLYAQTRRWDRAIQMNERALELARQQQLPQPVITMMEQRLAEVRRDAGHAP